MNWKYQFIDLNKLYSYKITLNMSKFQLSKEITDLLSKAVTEFASRVEDEFKVNKERIIEIWNDCSEDNITVSKPKTTTSAATKQKVAAKAAADVAKIQNMAKAPPTKYKFKKNQYGNYENADTHFVVDAATMEVYGKQVDDKVVLLTLDDVEVGKRLGFKLRIPETFLDEAGQDIDDNISDVDPEEDHEEHEENDEE